MKAVATDLLFDPKIPVQRDPTQLLFGAVNTAVHNIATFLAGVPRVFPQRSVAQAKSLRRGVPTPQVSMTFQSGATKYSFARVPGTGNLKSRRPMAHLSASGARQMPLNAVPMVSNLDMAIRQAPHFVRKEFDKHLGNLKTAQRNLSQWFVRVAANVGDMIDGKQDNANLVAARNQGFGQFKIA